MRLCLLRKLCKPRTRLSITHRLLATISSPSGYYRFCRAPLSDARRSALTSISTRPPNARRSHGKRARHALCLMLFPARNLSALGQFKILTVQANTVTSRSTAFRLHQRAPHVKKRLARARGKREFGTVFSLIKDTSGRTSRWIVRPTVQGPNKFLRGLTAV